MRRDRRGNAALEAVLLVPVVILLAGLIAAGIRTSLTQIAITNAAGAAARAATLERSGDAAAQSGRDAGLASLSGADAPCNDRDVIVDTSQFSVPVGQPATVRATVTCTVDFTDLLLPLPGWMSFTETKSSPLDTYRGRS